MTGVVLDTNVLVSANLNDQGHEALVVSLALGRRLQIYISVPILTEYGRVLNYPRLKFNPDTVASFLRRLRDASAMVHPRVAVTKAKHEPDNRFLECAQEAQADYLVTGNLRHFPPQWKDTRVVNSRQLLGFFLERMSRGEPAL